MAGNKTSKDETIVKIPDRAMYTAHSHNYQRKKQRTANTISDTKVSVSIGGTIKSFRQKAGIKQKDFAEMLNISRNTIISWESGRNRPDIDSLPRICSLLGVSLNTLFGISENKESPNLSLQEQIIIENYRKISPLSQRIVFKNISNILEEEILEKDKILEESTLMLDMISLSAAAGNGDDFCDIQVEDFRFVFKNDLNKNADAIIRVSGHSMEPVYHDNDYVYIKYTEEADVGEDIVCISSEGLHIKRLGDDGPYSVNKEYPFILSSPDFRVKIIGIVLGIVQPSDYTNTIETDSLMEIRHDDIVAFKKKNNI